MAYTEPCRRNPLVNPRQTEWKTTLLQSDRSKPTVNSIRYFSNVSELLVYKCTTGLKHTEQVMWSHAESLSQLPHIAKCEMYRTHRLWQQQTRRKLFGRFSNPTGCKPAYGTFSAWTLTVRVSRACSDKQFVFKCIVLKQCVCVCYFSTSICANSNLRSRIGQEILTRRRWRVSMHE